ncbi:NUDIX domain-containing protein [Pseudomonas leptonychotis]|uniref:NUDIX hydrolase n=1 Tax=Pseudomonas leptonychotis TaxID=2448482 RepID=A0A4T1ZRN3_9PSED|nr:NUDIX hydrolase [Pseudomonas leptonychotis]TIH06813.1 NUDIX hydrolase [Pseudomonas leptonychotis]
MKVLNFPTKRVAVGALIRDQASRLLLVKPVYREGWLLPGGVVDSDESPRSGLCRELREELGLILEPQELLCVDYVSAHDNFADGLHLLFNGGVLSDDLIRELTVCDSELHTLQWLVVEEAMNILIPSLARRLRCLLMNATDQVLYMENGEYVNLSHS